ncbi:unnamed protein product [Danaus chrysippus]|uniref:(African queen) hypothetical protein n=1 Tax=Danaus chrysippus TaxID=151541 RepID=A0A8J2VWH3_9NEOP|nr:unnamed protein product [Danaus chrysippus]
MVQFITVTQDMREAVIRHLRDSFFADEPLNKAVGLCQRGQPHAALERLCVATIADGLSVAAVERDTIFNILYTVSRDLELFQTFGVDRVLECRIVSVSEHARGRGLAKELMKRSIQIAMDHGFKLFKVDATGAYSQRICSSLGLRVLQKVRYSEHCDQNGPIFKVPPPHDSLCIMALEIP